MQASAEYSRDVLCDTLRQPDLEAPCLAVHDLECAHLLVCQLVGDRLSDLAVEILDDRRDGQHDGRLHFEDILPYIFESAAERDCRSAVYAGQECRGALVAVMHRKHREADVLRACLKHRLHQYRVKQQVSVREHYALRHTCGAGCEDDGREVGVDHLRVDVAAVSGPDLMTAFFAEPLP